MMKTKYILFLLPAVLLGACGNEKKGTTVIEGTGSPDSLMQENEMLKKELAAKDTAINQSIRMFNEIEDNLALIGQKQGLINTSDPELQGSEKDKIIDEIQAINTLLEENKNKVNTLRSKLKRADVKIGELEKMLERLIKDVEMKENTITELREELAKYDIAMDELTATLNETQGIVQEKEDELNTAYYVYGSSKELKEQGIITTSGGFIGIGKIKKLKDDLNKDYFTQIDIIKTKEITLGAKKVEILSTHPKSSYKLIGTKTIEKLEILNPKEFWSVSKYLVVVLD